MEPAAENRARPTELKSDHLYYGIVALVLISPLVFFPSLINLYRLPKIAAISLLVTALTWIWLFLLIQEKEQRAVFPLAIPISIYLGISVLSLTKAANPLEGIFSLSQETIYIFLFFIVVNYVRTREKIEILLQWAIPTAVIVSLIGIYQIFGGRIPTYMDIGSPGSTFGNKNTAAQYITLMLPFPYLFLIATTDRQKERLFAICAAVLTTYLLYTGTRAAWAGCIVAFLAILILLRLKKPFLEVEIRKLKGQIWNKRITLGCILIFVVAMNLIPSYVVPNWNVAGFSSPVSRFGTALELDQDTSFLNRLALSANTLEIFKDHPLLGVGKGNWKITYPLYATRGIKDIGFAAELQPREAHNDYVQLLSETGLFGFLLFLWMLVLIGSRVWNSIPGKGDSRSLLLILTLLFSVVALLMDAWLDFPFELPVSTGFFWLFAGLLWVSCEKNSPSDTASSSADSGLTPRRGTLAVGLICVLSILFTAMHVSFLRAEFYGSRGTLWFYESREGPWQPAEKDLKTAAYLNPTTHRYLYTLGLLYIWLGKYEEAIEANLRALKRHPFYINGYTNLGVAYASAGKITEAEQAWKRALEIWPDHNDARNNLATVYALQGKRAKAIALLKESLIRNANDENAKQKLGALLKQTGPPRLTPKP